MILVSACLLGCACRYDGQSKPNPLAQELARRGLAVPVCPEQLGGLPTPRNPSERRGDRVVMNDGRDVTAEYHRGAEETLRLGRLYGCSNVGRSERQNDQHAFRVHDGSAAAISAEGKRHQGLWRERIGEAAVSRPSHFLFHQRRTSFGFTFGRNTGIL